MSLTFRILLMVATFAWMVPISAGAQKMLLIEKYGRPKSKKIYIGEELTFKLRGTEGYFTQAIEDLRTDTQLIVFPRMLVAPSQIESFRYDVKWGKAVGRSLVVFGLGWSFFAGVADLADLGYDYTGFDAIVSGTAIGTGILLELLFKRRTIKFGKRRRLRIVDVTFGPPPVR